MSESPFDAPGEMVLISVNGGGRSSAMSRMMSATSALGQPAPRAHCSNESARPQNAAPTNAFSRGGDAPGAVIRLVLTGPVPWSESGRLGLGRRVEVNSSVKRPGPCEARPRSGRRNKSRHNPAASWRLAWPAAADRQSGASARPSWARFLQGSPRSCGSGRSWSTKGWLSRCRRRRRLPPSRKPEFAFRPWRRPVSSRAISTSSGGV